MITKTNLNKISVALILFFTVHISLSQEVKYGDLTFNKAINISGKQRMLTQRIGKAYLYLLNNPNDSKAKNDLKITGLIFEKQNIILENNTSSGLTRNRINEVKTTWIKYKKFIESVPNKENAKKIINTNSTILKLTNNVVNAILLESQGSSNSGDNYLEEENSELKQIINKAGRQRMLSQRLALYYFANKQGLKTEKTSKMLEKVFAELDNAINDLLISSFNNERIDAALGNVMSTWETISTNKEQLFMQGYKDAEIYKLSNTLTGSFNKITNLYEKVRVN